MDLEDTSPRDFLGSLINKQLRVEIQDGRYFHGQLKCTDPDMNIVLSNVYEHQKPQSKPLDASSGDASPPLEQTSPDLEHRALRSVVIPGEHIVKIELEEFASQRRHKFPAII
ncbi:hypothetical protein CFIMG_005412RA [Ceratocystis fimbriata CBS 114723]|uniref:Sm domain-containing protein n=1 Tax=Ceratocystis fimbriata CBS 114723 TaxID=1035309 RepID=A0A2C5X3X0_9PEZI|nr:hypothetical protein CFIMG_005412RA [Ceratocystis fimbriata CBS 114723]